MPESYGITLFCEDIRFELGGKVSYMGIFGQDMTLAAAKPALLPKMAFAIHLSIPSSLSRARVRIAVRQETKGHPTIDLAGVEGEFERPPEIPADDGVFTYLTFHLAAVPFHIVDDCELAVRAYVDDREVKLGRLPVRFVAPPDAV